MPYKAVIMAAGEGSRISYSKVIHKTLLPVGGQAVLSRIIQAFPVDIEIVIAVGYKAQQIKDYISLAHPDRNISYVEVDKWKGKGAGPGYSLLACKQKVQCSFIFTSADTLVTEPVPSPIQNWLGVSAAADTKDFLMAEVIDKRINKFYDKKEQYEITEEGGDLEAVLPNAFIGMAGVKDYKVFWSALEKNKNKLDQGELQVAQGLRVLVAEKMKPIRFTWHDTGSDRSFAETNVAMGGSRILVKDNEFIYFQKSRVIKFFADIDIVEKRVRRADMLSDYVPTPIDSCGNFYSYRLVLGKRLSDTTNNTALKDLLDECRRKLWREISLTNEESQAFYKTCNEFYELKTKRRINDFFDKTGIHDKEGFINGTSVAQVSELLAGIDWQKLSQGVPALWHGDFQPENIIITKRKKFVLLDWRHDFGGQVNYGDVYYDFAKFYHALIINAQIIRDKQFNVEVSDYEVQLNYLIKGNLFEYFDVFREFVNQNKWDWHRVELLGTLMYLNIAPLHHSPYNEFLFYFGKMMLNKLRVSDNLYIHSEQTAPISVVKVN